MGPYATPSLLLDVPEEAQAVVLELRLSLLRNHARVGEQRHCAARCRRTDTDWAGQSFDLQQQRISESRLTHAVARSLALFLQHVDTCVDGLLARVPLLESTDREPLAAAFGELVHQRAQFWLGCAGHLDFQGEDQQLACGLIGQWMLSALDRACVAAGVVSPSSSSGYLPLIRGLPRST